MTDTTVGATAISRPPKQQRADCFEAAHRALETPIYDLMRMLHAAEFLPTQTTTATRRIADLALFACWSSLPSQTTIVISAV